LFIFDNSIVRCPGSYFFQTQCRLAPKSNTDHLWPTVGTKLIKISSKLFQ